MNGQAELDAIAAETSVCTKCKLHHSRKNAVPGDGPADSDIMFIGEGPGFHENEQGLPFVGAAGRFLDELLEGIGMSRKTVFITNIVKCRPPGNRDPEPEEMEACAEYLERQIKAIDPKVIVTLGRFSMARYFPKAKISVIHGRAKDINGRLVVPMYHPAAALHQPSLRSVVEDDFAKLPEMIKKGAANSQPIENGEDPEQLSMF
jgi:uracil-DNA glycosylase family 4